MCRSVYWFESDVSTLIDRPPGECCSLRPRHLEPLTSAANLSSVYLTRVACDSLHASASIKVTEQLFNKF